VKRIFMTAFFFYTLTSFAEESYIETDLAERSTITCTATSSNRNSRINESSPTETKTATGNKTLKFINGDLLGTVIFMYGKIAMIQIEDTKEFFYTVDDNAPEDNRKSETLTLYSRKKSLGMKISCKVSESQ
jgi:hypothetical protein